MLKSRDHDAIMRLQSIHHPQLREMTIALANNSVMTLNHAINLLSAEMNRLGLNELDLEMAHPAQSARVPFAVTSHGPADDFQRGVEASLRQRLGGQR